MPDARMLRSLIVLAGLAAAFAAAPALAQGFRGAATRDGVDAWLAGDGGVMWRSLDGGATWAPSALGTRPLRAVAARGFTVLVAGDSGQVWRSTNLGGSWTLRTIAGLGSLRSLASPSAGRAYLAGDGGLILRSDDGGDTWSPQASGTMARLNALAFLDDDHGWAAGAAGTLLRTDDGGANWVPVALGTAVELFTVAANGASVWVGGAEGGCWRSTTGGASFAYQDLGADLLPDVAAIALPAPDEVWIAGGGGFVRRSLDGGGTWDWLVHGLHGEVGGLAIAGGRGVVALRSARIAARWDGSDSLALPNGAKGVRGWTQQLSAGGAQIRGNTFAVNPRVRSTIYAMTGNTIHRSRNDGESWSNSGTIAGINRVNAFLVSPKDTNEFLVAGASIAGQRQILRSTNAGANWSVRLTHPFGEYGIPIERHPEQPDTLLFGGEDDVLYRSVDGGLNWSPWGAASFRSPCDLVITPGDPAQVIVADGITSVGHAYLHQSTDGGASFSMRDSVAGSEVPSLAVSRQRTKDVFAMTWSAVGARVSHDGGESWELLEDLNRPGQSIAATWGTDIARDDPNVVFAAVFSGGFGYYSRDGGRTFAPDSLPGANYALMARDRATVFALQSGGIRKLRFAYLYTPTVAAPALAVTAPNGGEAWNAGSIQPVTWNATNVALVRIEWRAGPSDAWILLAEADGHAGSWEWTVPPVPTTTAEIRVSDAWDGSPVDAGNGPFTIVAPLAADDAGPAAFALAPVSPSPLQAGSRARVSFDLPRPAHVELELYDVQGQRLRTLAERAFEPGRHALALDTAGLHAGVYFVRLRTGTFTASRRMLVLR